MASLHIILLVVCASFVAADSEYLKNGWYNVYAACENGGNCGKQAEWTWKGDGSQLFLGEPSICSSCGTSWFIHHKGRGQYSLTTQCDLDCNTWTAEGSKIIAKKLRKGQATIFKIEEDGYMNLHGELSQKYKISIDKPDDLAGNVVNNTPGGEFSFGDGNDPTRYVIKRVYEIVSGCNCPW